VKILLGREKAPLSRVLQHISGVIDLLFISKGKIIVIGAEPIYLMTYILSKLKLRHKCIYWTTWSWESDALSKKNFLPFSKKIWKKFLDDIVCVSVTMDACTALQKYGARAFHIPHGLDTELFRHKIPNNFSEKNIVLFAGRLLKIKGIQLIINIIKKYEWERTEFWFVGKGPYEDHIKRMKNENYPIRYFGQINDRRKLVSIYQDADMLILPSIKIGNNEERFGLVLLEAMACQLPVIASDCDGPKQIIENGKTGVLIPQNDEKALRDAILNLIKSPELRAKLGENGRKLVENYYDAKVAAGKWFDLIEKVHQAPAGRE
jgi:glycosyltransferase involved in cell wall biosynthesis